VTFASPRWTIWLGPSPMIKFLLSLTVLTFTLGLSAFADTGTGPLRVHPPDGWDENYQGEQGVQRYTLTRSDGENCHLTFSRWPAPGTQKEIPGFLNSLAERFLDAAKNDPKIKLASQDYTKGEFIGEPFSGKFVAFTMEGGLTQTIFMFSDGDGIWNGQFSGTAARWLDVLEILKAIKKSR
jgi:hypothetical protein